MAAQTADLHRLEDLDDADKTRQIASGDLAALRAVADWTRSFVARPHKDLGRDRPVCPFVPKAMERQTLWLAAERVADRSVADVVRLANEYKARLRADPTDGDGLKYKALVLVFTDLPADRAKGLFDEVLGQLAVPSYEDDGLVIGGFHKQNQGTAVHNRSFQPFMSPAPFLLMRHAVIGDWKFFLDDDTWLDRWARRYGESATREVAKELRRLPWRAAGGSPPPQGLIETK